MSYKSWAGWSMAKTRRASVTTGCFEGPTYHVHCCCFPVLGRHCPLLTHAPICLWWNYCRSNRRWGCRPRLVHVSWSETRCHILLRSLVGHESQWQHWQLRSAATSGMLSIGCRGLVVTDDYHVLTCDSYSYRRTTGGCWWSDCDGAWADGQES